MDDDNAISTPIGHAEVEFLTLEELREASGRADFAKGGDSRMTTMDFKPIDQAMNGVANFFQRAADSGMPIARFEFKGAKHVPAPPEDLRQYLPESQWRARDEAVELTVTGVKAGGYLVLRFTAAKGAPKTWGLAPGGAELAFHRSIPMAVAAAIAASDPAEAYGRMQARQLRASTPIAPGGEGGPRI